MFQLPLRAVAVYVHEHGRPDGLGQPSHCHNVDGSDGVCVFVFGCEFAEGGLKEILQE